MLVFGSVGLVLGLVFRFHVTSMSGGVHVIRVTKCRLTRLVRIGLGLVTGLWFWLVIGLRLVIRLVGLVLRLVFWLVLQLVLRDRQLVFVRRPLSATAATVELAAGLWLL